MEGTRAKVTLTAQRGQAVAPSGEARLGGHEALSPSWLHPALALGWAVRVPVAAPGGRVERSLGTQSPARVRARALRFSRHPESLEKG